MTDTQPLVILICTDINQPNVDRIEAHIAERGYTARVIWRPDLLALATYPAEHNHMPTLTQVQTDEWIGLVKIADVMFDYESLTLPHWSEQGIVPRLRWLQTTSAGVGGVVAAAGLDKTDIIVTTASGIHAEPLAEYVFMALLMWVKDYRRMATQKDARRWQKFSADELSGKTLTIVGPGRIGRRVAEIAHTFGMHVIAVPSTIDGRNPADYNANELVRAERPDLRAAFARTDALVLAMPHTPQTEGLIGADELVALPHGAYLINIARGAVIDEAALIGALEEGRLSGAALDVFATEPLPADSRLWVLPNVILSNHSASNAPSENARLTERFLHNLDLFVAGRYAEMSPQLNKKRGY